MIKGKILVPIVLLLFAVGCASGGMKKPTVFVDKQNNIPADIPSQFPDRYERFITGKEQKEFKKLMTDEERQVFIDKFWDERDPDPTTPENERKDEIDERIDNIANEVFFQSSGATGLTFRSNGGFRGDMAHVYLLHGEPKAMDVIEGNSFVPMMLWIYLNPKNGDILYAFLFYQKGGGGSFYLFPQDAYKIDPCGAVNEITVFKDHTYFGGGGNQACPDNVQQTFLDLQRASGKGGFLDGYFFAWALLNFSQDGSLLQGTALKPPEPASVVAGKSNARVVGEATKLTGTAGTDYILASCEQCNSLIPGELKLGEEFALAVRRGDIDWHVVGDQAAVELKVRVVVESIGSQVPPLVFESKTSVMSVKNLIVSDSAGQVDIILLTPGETAKIPPGTYRVSVYVKNMMTKKYNAWSKEFTK